MRISTRGRYALQMLLDLAEYRDRGFIALRDIAERQGISKKYLEHIVALLNHAHILRTNRGYQGGYMLAKTPEQYTIGQILRITEGSLCPVSCLVDQHNQCARSGSCITLPVWEGLARVVAEYLDGITLQTILDTKPSAGCLDGGCGTPPVVGDEGSTTTKPAPAAEPV